MSAPAPTSILARGETDENTWFDEINAAIEDYQRIKPWALEEGLDPQAAQNRYRSLMFYVRDLQRLGVTMGSDFGHA